MIQARLLKRYAARRDSAGFALDIELRAGPGVTVLFGSSGSGKTLTLDSIAGFVRPDEGRILLDDDLLFDAASGVHLPPQKRRCGYVFQNYALFPHMTLKENLLFAAARLPHLEQRRQTAAMLERFRLSDVAGRRPHELSGGQKQRCSIARALIGAPRILLLDEPGQGLDATLREDFYAVLRQVRAEFQTPVLLVTHDLDECFELGDEMVVMRQGRVAQSGTPAKILERPANVEVARLLGRFNLLPAEIRALDPGRNSSRLRHGEFDLTGPYFPGHLIGDRIWLGVRPGELTARPRIGRPGPNQIPATLSRAVRRPDATRLEFDNGMIVETQAAVDATEPEWVIEVAPDTIRAIRGSAG